MLGPFDLFYGEWLKIPMLLRIDLTPEATLVASLHRSESVEKSDIVSHGLSSIFVSKG